MSSSRLSTCVRLACPSAGLLMSATCGECSVLLSWTAAPSRGRGQKAALRGSISWSCKVLLELVFYVHLIDPHFFAWKLLLNLLSVCIISPLAPASGQKKVLAAVSFKPCSASGQQVSHAGKFNLVGTLFLVSTCLLIFPEVSRNSAY